jgi:leucyl/phenylalanyl-tRNA--protein transferase
VVSYVPFWLESDPDAPFPLPQLALEEPEGLLAIGGDLSPQRLLNAYRHGIFPWFSEGDPILWWSPAPRAVLFPNELRISRSLRKRIRQTPFEVTLNKAFDPVIEACSGPRRGEEGTWITDTMKQAYRRLHQLGHAHSVECWSGDQLVGGLYGVQLGTLFCGESMFSRSNDASKIALVSLIQQFKIEIELIDIQMMTPHMEKLGARLIERSEFIRLISQITQHS